MDLQEFWEVNKRWVLGSVLGIAVFFVAKGLIQSSFLDRGVAVKHRQAMISAGGEKYGQKALETAKEEEEALAAEEARLRSALSFELAPAFDLTGRGDPGVYWTELDATTRRSIRDALDARDVEFEPSALQWDTPVGSSEVRSMMLGLNLMQVAFDRLIAAHEQVINADPASRGIFEVERLKIETNLGGGRGRGRGRSASRRRGGEDLPIELQEEAVSFRIKLDPRVAVRWLEACRCEHPPLGLRNLAITGPDQPGEPATATGTFTATLFPLEEE